jgi:LacI family transcriptional regulator
MVEDDVLAQLLERTANLVLVGRDTPLPVSWVKADEEGGAYKLGRHLIAQGRRRPALLAVSEAYDSAMASERVRGFRRALTEAGLDLLPEHVVLGDWSFESGYVLGQQLLTKPDPPDAVFALAEGIAVGLVEAARHLGVRVPADLSVVTTEDNEWVKHVVPALTASHVPMFEVGVRATELLLARLADPDLPTEQLVIPTTMHVRESSLPLGRGELTDTN